MPYSVELLVDSVTEEAIRHAWHELSVPAGNECMRLHGVFPHVALVVVGELADAARICAELDELSGSLCTMQLSCLGIGCFDGTSGVVYLGLKKDDALTAVHACVAGLFNAAGAEIKPHYRSDSWVPHCTLAEELSCERCEDVLMAAQKRNWDLPFVAERLAMVQYPPTTIVASWQLPVGKCGTQQSKGAANERAD